MLKNYLKMAFRNIVNNKGFSLITILGLSVGMATAILIFLFVKHELSYDKFNENADRVYRVITQEKNENTKKLSIELSMIKYASELKKLSEIDSACRLFKSWENEFVYENNKIKVKQIFYSDSDIFNVFSFNALTGNVNNVFRTKNSAVITKSLANKVFHNVNPIDKAIKVGNQEYNISAVIDDVPETSHYKFDVLLSLNSLPWLFKQQSNEVYTYFRIKNNASIANVLTNAKNVCENILKMREKTGYFASIRLQPLLDIHLYSKDTRYKIANQGDIYSIYILLILALFILSIAMLNFANIFTASSQNRIKEIGIRKVLGSNKNNIAFQFLFESILISLLSVFFSYFLVLICEDKFSALMNRNIVLESLDYIFLFLFCLAVALLVGLISGIYPSLYLAKLSPQTIFTKNTSFGKKNKLLIGTVLVQFTIVIILISLMFVFNKQVNYMKNKDLGFDDNEVLVFDYYNSKTYLEFKKQLLNNTNIVSVTASQSVPGMMRSGQKAFLPGGNSASGLSICENRIQDDFIKTYGMQIIRGRDFDKNIKTDDTKVILNETAVKELGLNLDNAVGSQIVYLDTPQTIVGVVKDYHFTSMHTALEPLILSRYTKRMFIVSVKVNKKHIPQTIQFIKGKLNEFAPDLTFNYFFINESYRKMYEKEESQNILFISSVLLTITLALLGLLALTSLITFKRTKEVGIRKAFGASVNGIVIMFLKDVIKYIILSNFLAWPIAWFVAKKWLEGFPYKVEISFVIFMLAGVVALSFAFFLIIAITYKTATANPIDSLKYE